MYKAYNVIVDRECITGRGGWFIWNWIGLRP